MSTSPSTHVIDYSSSEESEDVGDYAEFSAEVLAASSACFSEDMFEGCMGDVEFYADNHDAPNTFDDLFGTGGEDCAIRSSQESTIVESENAEFEEPHAEQDNPPNPWDWKTEFSQETTESFDETGCGFACEMTDTMKELDYWKLAFPLEAFSMILSQSNAYAAKSIGDVIRLSKRQKTMVPIDEDELKRFLAVRIIMGIDKKPEIAHYWAKEPMFASALVPKIITSDRFYQIQRYLHFATESEDNATDKLRKIRELWTLITQNFSSLLVPFGDLSVDESLVKYRGRIPIRQFNRMKRGRFGAKTFSIVDAKTGFILNSKVYAGKDENMNANFNGSNIGHGGSILFELARGYLDKHRTVYADNYFTSPALAEVLLKRNTYLCGTLRANRKFLPKVPLPMTAGQCIPMVNCFEGRTTMVEYWKDKRIVKMISTGAQHRMLTCASRSGNEHVKPKTVCEYNKKARGIDQSDAHMSHYDSARKTIKWPIRIFFRLLEMSLFNAYVMMKSKKGDLPFLKFRQNLIQQIIEKTGGLKQSSARMAPPINSEARLSERHFPKKGALRRCKVCYKSGKKNRRTTYSCIECQTGLCAAPCFDIYHTKLNY